MAKSISVVVPPNSAARVPVSKSSALVVPPKGISRCVCTSMPPGITSFPAASIKSDAFSAGRLLPIAETFPSEIATSATNVSVAVTTDPFRMIVSKLIPVPSAAGSGIMLHCRPLVLENHPAGVASHAKGTSHAIRHYSQARHFNRTHRRTDASGRNRRLRIRLDLRLSHPLAGTLSAPHLDGQQHQADAPRHLRHQSRDTRPHRDGKLIRHAQPHLGGPHSTMDKAW